MSKRTKLLGGSWSECSSSSTSHASPTFSSLDSPSSLSSVSDFSEDQTVSNDMAMEVISHQNSNYEDERFLGLPFEIWTQIFRYAGIICPCAIDLVTVNHRPAGSSAGQGERGNLSHAMMRAMSTDIVTCALRRSHFRRSCEHTSFLPMLAVSSQSRQFTRRAIFQESLLVFVLRTMEDLMGLKQTLRGFARMAPLEQSLKRIQVVLKTHDGRRLTGTTKKKSAINLYKAFCDYVGSKLQGTLKDYIFECRVGDQAVTRELLDKMANNFEMLSSCSFRFEYSGPGSISSIASNAAVKTIMRKEHTTQPFRFMDLPNELKEMILKKVLVNRWNPAREDRCIFLLRNPYQPLLSCCSDCSAHFARGCSCVSRERYSTSCTCFTSPVPIFLTSKFIYNMASYIFFTQNTFAIGNYGFLFQIPQKHTQLIRHMVLEFIPYLHRSSLDFVVNFIRENFDPTRLTLDLVPKIADKDSPYAGTVDMVTTRLKGFKVNAS